MSTDTHNTETKPVVLDNMILFMIWTTLKADKEDFKIIF